LGSVLAMRPAASGSRLDTAELRRRVSMRVQEALSKRGRLVQLAAPRACRGAPGVACRPRGARRARYWIMYSKQ